MILILGQPRSGKSILAAKLAEIKNYDILCTDSYRYNLGYHESHKGYCTEINPERTLEFYNKLLNLIPDIDCIRKNLIIEGSAINPKDISIFNPEAVVILGRTKIDSQQMLKDCRERDYCSWTRFRNDKYLLKLFNSYLQYSREYETSHKDLFIDTSNFSNGIEQAKQFILNQLEQR